MRIDIMTLFPDAVDAMMKASIIGRAQERGFVTIRTHQIREYTTNKQMQVDDYPYGGGRGAVMQADPLYRCWQHICDEAGGRVHTIYMSPAAGADPAGGPGAEGAVRPSDPGLRPLRGRGSAVSGRVRR